MTGQRNIMITAALPYANGPIHLGHMVEYLQADIWARFQRSRGHQCLFICGDDWHGTPIMLSAQKEGITPEDLVQRTYAAHAQDFNDFFIHFDSFYNTHAPENEQLVSLIYKRLKDKGDIETRTISQAYDPEKNMFLPDRFIKGECPCCEAKDQYGDNCESCGSTYSPSELKNPISILSGEKPIEKESLHYFFKLQNYQEILGTWLKDNKQLQPQVIHKLLEWFDSGLKPWDISRDAPYFGFEIPDAPGKYFYVWMDAPVGYMASLQHLCAQREDLNFDDYWQTDSKIELYHFVGKDIIYFHALFWPAMLNGANFRMPNAVWAHGFLTVNGKKMSKSRGTFITAHNYLKYFDPEYLRYYFAAKLTHQVEDIDLNLTDFMYRVNSDLVGKFINIASRCAGFIHKKSEGKLATQLDDADLYQKFVDAGENIAECYENRDYNRGMRLIMELADQANQYIDHHKPWKLAKDPQQSEKVQMICTQGINLFRVLMIYLQPVLPKTAEKSAEFLNTHALQWQDRTQPLLDHTINLFNPLMSRITKEQIDELTSE